MDALLGTQGWAYEDWAGTMYDAAARPDTYLRAYAEEFATVEIDSTFYGTPEPERVAKWAATVPPGFRFSCKLAREITHERRMDGVKGLIGEFYDAMRAFGPKLGCVLVQFDASFGRDAEPALRTALDAFPPGMTTAFEFRDPAWYAPDVQAWLEERGFALALADAPFVPREVLGACLQRTTLGWAYLRWIGIRDAVQRFNAVVHPRGDSIAWWAAALRAAPPRLKRVFGYANNHFEGHAPATIRVLYEALGVKHERPKRIEQTTLF
jgi:uncharacterized protein YecE (DUF72 family)